MIKKIFVSLLTSYVSLNACAYPFKNIIFFGDSLSDNGNLYDTLKIPKSPPYYKGHFSNGPVWSEYVGDYFKEQYDTKYKDFAVGGSTAILRSPTDGALPYTLKDQIDKYLKTDYSVNETLYSIWIGANDYLDEKKQDPDKLVSEVISEIVSNTKTLIDKGGKHFLMMDLPDLTKTPYVENFNDEEKQRMIKLSELHHIKLAE
ncbi:MAG TPA: SGNH/GDSL hydrolase family protein, partial [Gammaproteobacteria bacterium]|nr:SGNH/GDSL hydrolase family protein [Gammaproteobacteria bacterium]